MKLKELKLPFIIDTEDYHDFDYCLKIFRCAGVKLKFHEIGCAGQYYGIFYEGKKPSNTTIENLLVRDYNFGKKLVKHFVKHGDTDLRE